MDLKLRTGSACVLALVAGLALGGPVYAASPQDKARLAKEVEKLSKECEADRQKALEPIRAQKTQACIEQQLRSKGHCERYYTTYGNVTPSPTGRPQVGYFYDLPKCQQWLDARRKLEVENSRR
jgi:hypothetical protein